jgi:hypothetical protein
LLCFACHLLKCAESEVFFASTRHDMDSMKEE